MLSYYGNSSSKLNLSFTCSMTQHIEVSVTSLTCKHINFGGHDYSFFGDIATFNFRQFSLRTMVAKKFNQSESVKKCMQVEVDITCMLTKFNGHGLSSFGDIATSNFAKFSFWTIDYIHGMSHIVTYCHVLSRIVTYCHVLSRIVTYCCVLSRIVMYYCRVLLRIVTYCHILSRIVTCIVTYCYMYCHVFLRILLRPCTHTHAFSYLY